MNSGVKLALGVVLAVLVAGSIAAYAAPLATQARLRDGTHDQLRLRDPTSCPNFVDEDGDGVCDNCPNGTGEGLGGQYRHGWRAGGA